MSFGTIAHRETIPNTSDAVELALEFFSNKKGILPLCPDFRNFCVTNVKSTTNYLISPTSTGNFTIVVLPAAMGDIFGWIYEEMSPGVFSLATSLKWATDIDTFYDLGRVVSANVEVFNTTQSTTTAAFSGLISAAQPETTLGAITGSGTVTDVYGYSNLPSFTTNPSKILVGQPLWQGIAYRFFGETSCPYLQLFDYPTTGSGNLEAYRFDPNQSIATRTTHTIATSGAATLITGQTLVHYSDEINFDGLICSFDGTYENTIQCTTTAALTLIIKWKLSFMVWLV